MVAIQRVRVALTGLPGLPGVSTFYANAGADMVEPLRALYAAFATTFPLGLVATVEPFGDTIEDSTGTLVGSWVGTAAAPVLGSGQDVYSAPSGMCINWLTGVVVGGRRLRGKTFMVPLRAAAYDTNGTLQPSFLADVTLAAATFQVATAATFLVWGRPRPARAATPTRPAQTARAGTSALVTSSTFKDKAAVLRSRRD